MSLKEKAKGKPGAALAEALRGGKMDLAGLDEVGALYADLAPVVMEELPLEKKAKLPPPAEVKMRLEEGFSLVEPAAMAPKAKELARRASAVAEVLARHSEGGSPSVDRALKSEEGREVLAGLASLYLEQGEEALRFELEDQGLDPQIATFVLFNALKGSFLALGNAFAGADLKAWQGGACPVCGGAPAVGTMEGDGGKRHLVCHRCETKWGFHRIVCPFCGNDDNRTLGYLREEGASPRMRADYCDSCGSYLKVFDLREGGAEVAPQVEDLLTPRLDLAAEDQGYHRGGPNVFGVRMDQGKEKE